MKKNQLPEETRIGRYTIEKLGFLARSGDDPSVLFLAFLPPGKTMQQVCSGSAPITDYVILPSDWKKRLRDIQ